MHGLWVWKSPEVLQAEHGIENLASFCMEQRINEIYVSFSAATASAEEGDFVRLIGTMHRADIRIEALLSSTDADQPGEHRNKLLERVGQVIEFNRRHPRARFDGIHLDVEPQQRPENKGSGNLRFLPGLVDLYGQVRERADSAGITVNADIQTKLLKGDATQRRMLLSAVSRVTLMLYELSRPDDGQTPAEKADRAAEASQRFLEMAYAELSGGNLAPMEIALRTADYSELLPTILERLDQVNRDNPHYLGWARHSYNDMLAR